MEIPIRRGGVTREHEVERTTQHLHARGWCFVKRASSLVCASGLSSRPEGITGVGLRWSQDVGEEPEEGLEVGEDDLVLLLSLHAVHNLNDEPPGDAPDGEEVRGTTE